MIGQSTHIINGKSSCIDFLPLIANFFLKLESRKLLCHHNIICGSLNVNKPLLPPYYRDVWDYQNTDPLCIQHAISLVNWNDVFSKKTADEKVKSLSNILLNIFRNFIHHKDY